MHLVANDDDGLRPTLIVGSGRVGRLVEQRLRREPSLGLNPVGFLDDDPLYPGDGDAAAPVLGGIEQIEWVVREFAIQQVLVAFSSTSDEELLELARRCQSLGVAVAVVPRLFELAADRRNVHHLGCIPLIGIRRATPTRAHLLAKGLVERVGSLALLILLVPVFAVAAAAVLVSLGRPVLFRQRRIGRNGKAFELVKLRTMRERRAGCDGADESDRCTAVGAFLRRTSLDELPQLFNVLRGDMSFIGPRPERAELVDEFRRRVYRYDERHRVKPGISGWAQVHGIGRGDDRFEYPALAERAEWDNFYIEHWSRWLELKILFMTLLAICRFRQPSSSSAAIHFSELKVDDVGALGGMRGQCPCRAAPRGQNPRPAAPSRRQHRIGSGRRIGRWPARVTSDPPR